MRLETYLNEKQITTAALASVTGISPELLSYYKKGRRKIPIMSAVVIEKATDGEVSRKDCRPDDWHMIWPELIQESEACHG